MTVETEDKQKAIDDNLTLIDSQQQELSSILDQYEQQVQKLFEKDATTAGVNSEGLRPVDEQREQAYSLAESLNKQLDDMALNLTSMIEEINQTAPKTDETSDPVSFEILQGLDLQSRTSITCSNPYYFSFFIGLSNHSSPGSALDQSAVDRLGVTNVAIQGAGGWQTSEPDREGARELPQPRCVYWTVLRMNKAL